MVPLNLFTRLISRPQLMHNLSRNLSTTGELLGCGHRQSRDDCRTKKCEEKLTKARRKCKPMESSLSGRINGKGKGSVPEFCSKTALAEFACKMEELQNSWDSIAAQMEKECEAKGYKRDEPKKVKYEAEEEKSSGAVYIVVAALVFAAILAYFLYLESEKKNEGGGEKKDGDEKKDGGEKKAEDPKK